MATATIRQQLEICKVFMKYTHENEDVLAQLCHMKTGLVQLNYSKLYEIYQEHKKEAESEELETFFVTKYGEELEKDEKPFVRKVVKEKEEEREGMGDDCESDSANDTTELVSLNGAKMKIGLTSEILEKIIKKKKNKKYYREMGVKHKDMDNQIDFMIQVVQSNERFQLRESQVNEFDGRNKKIIDYYSEMDVEFRQIMRRINSQGKGGGKESTLTSDLKFIEEYFRRHFGIEVTKTNTNKLANTVVEIMRELQRRIFSTDDEKETDMLLFFKNRLYSFYNFYRK
ncbi:hypothetical protein ECANGB1_1944 [Enterospora canceri]|uniref:Uncharacterized protein n=1 Tax=Enterospora canceri TaxID=1081671 RepID=A0A1Y1S6F9_9MICR|nr:hypothetical protein ECANGB1_1944 [Enterospora canceri]